MEREKVKWPLIFDFVLNTCNLYQEDLKKLIIIELIRI